MSTIGDLLEKTCKDVIQTILCCIDHATKGTIYRIGPMPQLRAIRVTSGIRLDGTDQIQWGFLPFRTITFRVRAGSSIEIDPITCWKRWVGVWNSRRAGRRRIPSRICAV